MCLMHFLKTLHKVYYQSSVPFSIRIFTMVNFVLSGEIALKIYVSKNFSHLSSWICGSSGFYGPSPISETQYL